MRITVAICTWNRSKLLDKTLEAMHHLIIPEHVFWDIVVVNNKCTDNTDAVITKHSSVLPVTRILEPRQGLSNARNAAVAVATGDFIIWTDDDVLVDAGWLLAYCDAFASRPGASFFGGPVRPWFEGSPPAWMHAAWRHVSTAYAVRDFGVDPFMLSDARLPFGANFAVRTEVQRRFPYDPSLGLVHGAIILGEESAVMTQMFRAGEEGWWVPGAAVRHWIPSARQTLGYIRKYYRGYGRSLSRRSGEIGRGWRGKPFWLWRKAIVAECGHLFSRLFEEPDAWMAKMIQASTFWGMIYDE